RLDPRTAPALRPLAGDLGHQRVDELELLERRPAGVVAAPARTRLHPDGEGLGEVLRRMALRIPLAEVEDVTTTRGARRVARRIAPGSRPEDRAPVAPLPQTIGGVERVARL